MCTVTLFSKSTNNFVLTSNRDEAIGRKTLPIAAYDFDKQRLLFPKDEVAGGTWIAASEKQTMLCLLNGGNKDHYKQKNYRHSRGIVVTDILQEASLFEAMHAYNCENLEPFTLIGVDWNKDLRYFQLVWDGEQKQFQELDTTATHIWSSSTLYTQEMKNLRKQWIKNFEVNKQLDQKNILDFHKNAGNGNSFHDLQIKRGNLQTRSITQVSVVNNNLKMRYEDLLTQEVFEESLQTVII